MVMSALDSFMTKVAWAPLDVLVIDMPPGTGDFDQLALSGSSGSAIQFIGAFDQSGISQSC